MPSVRYKQTPNDIEKNKLNSEANKGRFNFAMLEKTRREKSRLEKFHKKIYQRNKLRLRFLFEVGQEVLILALQIKKKDDMGRFYESSINNKPSFHKTFLIKNRQKIEENFFFWLTSTKFQKNFKFRFQREEIFAILDNFN